MSLKTSTENPKLSIVQIINMSVGFFGIQFGWDLQRANMGRNAYAKFINLKKKNNIFNATNASYGLTDGIKYVKLIDGANTVVVVGNFDVVS